MIAMAHDSKLDRRLLTALGYRPYQKNNGEIGKARCKNRGGYVGIGPSNGHAGGRVHGRTSKRRLRPICRRRRTAAYFCGGLASGVGDPIFEYYHLAAIVGIGILAGIAARGLIPLLAFSAASIIGVAIQISPATLPFDETVVALTTIGIGALVVRRQTIHPQIASILFAIAGLFHGYSLSESIAKAPTAPLLALYRWHAPGSDWRRRDRLCIRDQDLRSAHSDPGTDPHWRRGDRGGRRCRGQLSRPLQLRVAAARFPLTALHRGPYQAQDGAPRGDQEGTR